MIPENANGHIDMEVLVQKLQKYAKRPLKIGAFSAASNVTGILSDVDTVTATLHRHGALAFWDYAACAPYVSIDMNPAASSPEIADLLHKDAVYFSGHKFLGGPGSPGVLVVKRNVLCNPVPSAPGGGTVLFVTEHEHRYLPCPLDREEGGTPSILGSIRLGLAMQTKQRIGSDVIMAVETQYVHRARTLLARNENIVILGQQDTEQLPIFSLMIRCGARFLHYNFVCALLNDVFGVQSRGGCQCAGPYATRLLGLRREQIIAYEQAMLDDKIGLRPGFSRVSFPYFMSEDEVDYVLQAIHFVAKHGWKLLPLYDFDVKTGVWTHRSRRDSSPLEHLQLDSVNVSAPPVIADIKQHWQSNLDIAYKLAEDTRSSVVATNSVGLAPSPVQEADDKLRWFEADDKLRWFVWVTDLSEAFSANEPPSATPVPAGPCQPKRYVESVGRNAAGAMESPGPRRPLGSKRRRVAEWLRRVLKRAPRRAPARSWQSHTSAAGVGSVADGIGAAPVTTRA
ncbi:hypothetical protein ATCC90586_003965 [Pythium insidiosum]|nr:hypothetical protein ATCC90586_003965 [Pythium insidiosum]